MGYSSLHLHFAVLLASLLAVNSQTQRGTCFANVGCTGTSTQSGLVGDLMEHCCIYTNPGVTRGFSYQFFGIEQCFACPRILGFFEQDFRGEERANPHALTIGILSGPPLASNSFGSLEVSFSIGFGPNSASSADFALTQPIFGLPGGATFMVYNVQHQVDAVAQENDEQYSIHLSNMFGFDDYIIRSINITIVDSDTVAFLFNEADHSKNEGSDLVLVASIAKTAGTILANPVTFSIFPVTITEARNRDVVIPRQADLVNDPKSPYEAIEADFNTTSFNVTFPADEGGNPITNVDVRVNIVDDNINERFEQLFIIGAEVVEATNPSAVDNTQRNVTIGIIVDNDDLVIGFNQSRYEFDEPESITEQFIYLVKEDDKPTEQTFDVQINYIPSTPVATRNLDFILDFFSPTVDRPITPDQKSVLIKMTLFIDEIAEGNEQFILESSPVNNPKYSIVSSGSTVFRSTTVVIRDNDPIIIGYEEPVYSLNENSSTMVCINVTNPPLMDPLTVSGIFLSGPSTLISAGSTDYSPSSLFYFVSSSPANSPSRTVCIPVSASQDNILEDTEEVEFSLIRLGSSTDFLLLQPNRTILLILDQDVVTVGFIGAPYSVIESDGMASLTIGLIQGQLAVPVTLNVQLVDGSAQASGDYLSTLSSSTVTLNGSTPNVTITFPIVNDNIFEVMESLSASLSLAQSGGYYSRVTVDPATAVVSIADDDVLTFGFQQLSYQASESAGLFAAVIGLRGGAIGNFGVSLAVQTEVAASGIAATAGSDYVATSSNTSAINSVNPTASFSVAIVNDPLTELTEFFSARIIAVNYLNMNGVRVPLTSAITSRIMFNPAITTLGILDDDVTIIGFDPAIYSALENGGPIVFMFGILSGQLAFDVDINFNPSDGTALAGSDYTYSGQSLYTFSGIATDATASVDLVDDAIQEQNENFFGNLSFVASPRPANVVLNPSLAEATIMDNDRVVIGFSPVNYTVTEGGSVTFNVEILSGTLTENAAIEFFTTDDTATASNDYSSLTSTLTFDSTTSSFTVAIATLNDGLLENPESFFGNLRVLPGTPSSIILAPAQARATIMDNDVAVIGFNRNYTVPEGSSANLQLEVLSGTLAREVVISVSTNDGSAEGPGDYGQLVSQLVTFAPGSTQVTVPVSVTADNVVENPEFFTVSATLVSSDAAVTVSPDTSFVNIQDNSRITVGFDPTSYVVNETVGSVTLTARIISGMLARPAIVNFFTLDGSAMATADYTAVNQNLIFNSGTSMVMITVPIVNDDAVESMLEFFTGNLGTTDASVDLAPDTARVDIREVPGDDNVIIGLQDTSITVMEDVGLVEVCVELFTDQSLLERNAIVILKTEEQTARPSEDYVGIAPSLTFTPTGDTVICHNITIVDDSLVEDTQVFLAALETADSSVRLLPDIATISIVDNDEIVIGFVRTKDSVLEDAGSLAVFVEVKNSGLLQKDVIVSYSSPVVSGSTASIGSDYQAVSGDLTFSPSNTRLSFPVTILNDNLAEGPENFFLQLSTTEQRVMLAPMQMEVEIIDDDVVDIGFLMTTYNGMESDKFVTLSVGVIRGQLEDDFVVTLATQDLTTPNAASSPDDYQPITTQLTFTNSITRLDVNVTLVDDDITENMEEFQATLAAVTVSTSAFVSPSIAKVTIEDNDRVTIGFNRTNYSVNEADGSVTLTVRILDGILDRTAVVNFFTTDGSATSTAPVDFLAVMGSDIVFNAGTISNIEVVTIVNDGVLENVENFFGNLATNDSAVIIAPGMTTVDIVEDPADSVRVGFDPMDYSVDESAGSINLTIRILEGTLERPVTVSFSTMDGTATSTAPSNDFVAVANQDVVFDPSTDSRNVAVTIVEDNRAEVTENFYGNLSTSDGSVQLSPDSARVDILESSRVDRVTIGMDEMFVEVDENVGQRILCASLMTGTLERPAQVTVVYQDRRARMGTDYVDQSVTLTFTPQMTRLCFNVSIVNDDNYELAEEFFVNITTTEDFVDLSPMFTVMTIIDDEELTIGWSPDVYTFNESIGQGELCAVAVVNGVPTGEIQANLAPIPIVFVDDTATAGDDYMTSPSPSFIFTSTSGNRLCTTVNIVQDQIFEMDREVFYADMSIPSDSRITIDPARAEVGILDDDEIVIGFNQVLYIISEGQGTTTLSVSVLSGMLAENRDVVVLLETKDDTAISLMDVDYEAATYELTFSSDDMEMMALINITDDQVDEDSERFSAELSLPGNPSRVTLDPSTTNVDILDNDLPVIGLEDTDYTTTEGDDPIEICARLRPPPTLGREVVVMFSTQDGTATAGSGDYVDVSTLLTFDADTSRVCVNISVPNDGIVEAPENLVVVLAETGPPGEVRLDPNMAVLTINESQRVAFRFGQSSYTFNESDGMVTITVDKVGNTDQTVSVRVTGGPSTQPGVENSLPGLNEVVTFGPSETSKTISLTLADDNIALEPVESYVASLEPVDPSVSEVGTPGTADINVADDDGITVGFGSPNVTVQESTMTFMMCLVVQGETNMDILATITAVDGSAIQGEDYIAGAIPSPITIPAGQMRVCFNSSSIVDDSNQEPPESFMLRLLDTSPMNPNIIFSPETTNVIILDDDFGGFRVNDTVIGDPLYTVPISVPEEQLQALNLSRLSLCYEVHGTSDEWFNLVTDDCVSVSTRYTNLTRRLNVMDEVAVRAVDEDNMCLNIGVNVNGCTATVGGVSLNVSGMYSASGIMVKRYSNRVRISVPNCQDLTLVMWVICEQRSLENPDAPGNMLTSDMIKFVIMRGLNFGSRMAHGLLGQFWNVPVSIAPYNGLLTDGSSGEGRYVVNITARGMNRAYTGILHSTTWDHSEGPCLFVGNRQSGPIVEVSNPNDPVIQSLYTDYLVKNPFVEDDEYKFGMFNEMQCVN